MAQVHISPDGSIFKGLKHEPINSINKVNISCAISARASASSLINIKIYALA